MIKKDVTVKDVIILIYCFLRHCFRFVESYKVHSVILVSPFVTDLGEENEKLSGKYLYFSYTEKVKQIELAE